VVEVVDLDAVPTVDAHLSRPGSSNPPEAVAHPLARIIRAEQLVEQSRGVGRV